MPKFSVVISVYNKQGYIGKTLDSVIAQTFQDIEVVILNDGSTDNSEAEILPFTQDPRIRYFSEKNQGAAAGRNYAIRKANARYIALLDADDYWYPEHLSEINRLIVKYPEEMVFATKSEVLKNGIIFKRHYSIDIGAKTELLTNFFEASYLDSILHSSTTVFKKEVFEAIGYYDTALKSSEDTDLYVRIGLYCQIVFSSKVCVSYNVIKSSLSHTSKKVSDKADFSAYENFEKDNPALKKFLDLNRYSLCLLAKLEGNDDAFKENFKKIDLKNLSKKQIFLLKQNATTLKFLFKTKESLQNLGIRLSVFK